MNWLNQKQERSKGFGVNIQHSTVCTYRGSGHTASVSQPFLHPHRGVQESLHAEVPEDGLEVLAHLAEGLELLIILSLLQRQKRQEMNGKCFEFPCNFDMQF